jgi:hypothetical protein
VPAEQAFQFLTTKALKTKVATKKIPTLPLAKRAMQEMLAVVIRTAVTLAVAMQAVATPVAEMRAVAMLAVAMPVAEMQAVVMQAVAMLVVAILVEVLPIPRHLSFL